MASRESSTNAKPDRRRLAVFAIGIIAIVALAVWYLQASIPRRIVLASGVKDASYHIDAQNYARLLARDGVTVVERMSGGAGENARLLLDPKAGVDVAFMEGGVVPEHQRDKMVMLAAIRYEPIWIFYKGDESLPRLDSLRYKRLAVGRPGNGGRIIVESLLAATNVTSANTKLLPFGGTEALAALQAGTVDAAIFVGATTSPIIWQALHDDTLKLMSLEDAEAYARRFSYLSTLKLPVGTIDMSYRRIPPAPVMLVATKTMLIAREDLPSPLIDLMINAARELHSTQGFFERAREFPATEPVDLPVSADADRHLRFGPSFLHRYLPFWIATLSERLIVVVLPLLVILVPVINFMPQLLRWRVRSRIYRWYGELKLLERDVESRSGSLPITKWLADLDRIERVAQHIKTPASFASESYTLREHIALVRRTVMDRARGDATAAPARRAS